MVGWTDEQEALAHRIHHGIGEMLLGLDVDVSSLDDARFMAVVNGVTRALASTASGYGKFTTAKQRREFADFVRVAFRENFEAMHQVLTAGRTSAQH